MIEDDVFGINTPLDKVASDESAKIKKVTGAGYDKKTSTWTL